jgi:hypothetical protein
VEDSIGVLGWVHAQGFPKGKNKLKPAWEPIVLARKAGPSVLGVDACRVEGQWTTWRRKDGSINHEQHEASSYAWNGQRNEHPAGRWPTNLVLVHHPDCADQCESDCHVAEMDGQSGNRPGAASNGSKTPIGLASSQTFAIHERSQTPGRGDSGGASRFYPIFRFAAKASTRERPVLVRDGQTIRHPTVKPVALMRWLVRLVTPPGGTVLDPFCGSGATLEAALTEGFDALGFDTDPDSVALTEQRLSRPIATALG